MTGTAAAPCSAPARSSSASCPTTLAASTCPGFADLDAEVLELGGEPVVDLRLLLDVGDQPGPHLSRPWAVAAVRVGDGGEQAGGRHRQSDEDTGLATAGASGRWPTGRRPRAARAAAASA